ncbi:MAG: glycosyltransferase family 8 protein, partial [Puniceicoccales bacterium]|nr:glycosyltransferase family 8 protein [Puniceicoccales bacterium]
MEKFLKKLWALGGLLAAVLFSQQTLLAQLENETSGENVPTKQVKTIIPVVISFDRHFALQAYVTVISALKNANKDTTYHFHLLVYPNFEQIFKDEATKVSDKYDCQISIIEVETKLSDVKTPQFPMPPFMYQRLKIADLLPPSCKKCLCLGTGVMVRHDLAELYNTDIDGYYIAGVRDETSFFYEKPIHYTTSALGVNSGVVLMNLDLIRKDGLTEKFLAALEQGVNGKRPFMNPEQYVLNKVCDGKIKFLDRKYNLQQDFLPEERKFHKFPGGGEAPLTGAQKEATCDDPWIVGVSGPMQM